MSKSTEELYAALKEDVAAVSMPLFDLSKRLLTEFGNFLPHGYVLVCEGKDRMVGATEGRSDGTSTSVQTLPLLHEGLRAEVKMGNARAIGVAENVTIKPEGETTTKAIKVLLEHKDGLCVALYLPFKKKLFGGYVFGTPFTVAAAPEVNPQWVCSGA